jgi:hypothetical protein
MTTRLRYIQAIVSACVVAAVLVTACDGEPSSSDGGARDAGVDASDPDPCILHCDECGYSDIYCYGRCPDPHRRQCMLDATCEALTDCWMGPRP